MLDIEMKFKDGEDGEFGAEDNVKYLSWINGGTYGPPALIAPVERPNGVKAGVGDKVVFVNTDSVKWVAVERLSD